MAYHPLAFVVHKHKATSLHYDFRLEIGGVMPSWSIPKGPTLDNTLKRLAMPTTSHSMDYRHFEGIIQEGEYGAARPLTPELTQQKSHRIAGRSSGGQGPVMIWDEGYYVAEIEIVKGVRKEINDEKEAEKVMKEGLEKGEIKFVLHGKKLHGSFALVKTKGWGPKDSWLLIKHNDKYVEPAYDAKDYDFSAVSNRTLLEIEEGK